MMELRNDPETIQSETKRIIDILDAKYEPTDLNEVVKKFQKFQKMKREKFLSIKEI